MRLILGTAQLGLEYGIANKTGIPKNKEIDQIFSICDEFGITLCDTALSYGLSHAVVQNKGLGIITKINLGKNYKNDLDKIFNSQMGSKIKALLIHNPDQLISEPHYWDSLLDYRKKQTLKLGISVYDPDQVKQLLSREIIPEVIQIPYNVFDRKFEEILPRLKQSGIEIHSRSVFLQGLLVLKPNELPKHLQGLKSLSEQYHKFCGQNVYEKVKYALHFVLSNKLIDKVVIGVEQPKQLKEIIKAYQKFSEKIPFFDISISTEQKRLLNPTYWA